MKLRLLLIEHEDWELYEIPDQSYDNLLDSLYHEDGSRWWPMLNLDSGQDEIVNMDMVLRIEIDFVEYSGEE